ncbi:septum formation inhibitor Maf [candidate division KSB1 bacterium]|nr:septum formation inhibitor Maf [candidate division KSB1 bacterium]NIR68472.1 septum formation inhibitor Maf [candidate division KSB1 bacterium]NIS25123.1 septum formation inhibitor Maf [candidate division KSB1 bacterium]NIT72035.1 septum formation inhibitor Maf [candidate division KSB1 bacterium]NIU25822.1 septum formation inhibitor Maf [candidate division KSB1 bacterium]
MLELNGKKLILASSSPRRAQLLKLLGLDFEVIESNFDEENDAYTIPEVHVLELAHKKASKVAEDIKDGLIVGADTIVVLEDQMLGKPTNKDQAKRMLQTLSGKPHLVYTGFAIIDSASGKAVSHFEKTEVFFRELSESEIDRYVETDNPMDKAGAYGIQDQSAIFVTKVDGCFYNVVGFPVTKFYIALQAFLNMSLGINSN